MNSQDAVTNFSEPSVEVANDIESGTVPADLKDIIAADNLCELFDKSELSSHYDKILSGIAYDEDSMEWYKKKYKRALKRSQLKPDSEEKNFPFDNASNVVMPYLTDAAIDFNARTTPALLERQDPCFIKVIGKDEHALPPEAEEQLMVMAQQGPKGQQAAQQMAAEVMAQLEKMPPPKQARAERVANMINYDLTCGIKEWRDQTDMAMMQLPIFGMYFRKAFQCPVESRRKTELLNADKLIYDHNADSFSAAPRKSFKFVMSRNDTITAVRSGQFSEIAGLMDDSETLEYSFIETHCDLDLDDDGYAEPYLAIISELTGEFVSIVKRYDEEDIKTNKDGEVVSIDGEEFFSQTIFIPDPSGRAIGMGWGIIADDIYRVIDTNTNQMIDAGTLNNIGANSGFIRAGTRKGPRAGNRQKKGTIEMVMGKFTTLESDGTTPLQNDIAQMPFNGPSQPLMALMEALKVEVREMTTASQGGIEAQPNEAASMYLARLNQALIKPNSIGVRVMNGLTREFQRIYDIQRRYLSQEEYSEILDDPKANKEADYSEQGYDIKTTADPSQGSEMERTARAEAQLQMAMQMPQVVDLRYALTEWAKAVGADVDKLLPPPQPNQPDPVQQIVAAAQKEMSEAEKMSATADIMNAQVKMAEVNLKYQKLEAEIDEIESRILKNLSDVDKNQAQAEDSREKRYLDSLKEQRESFKLQRENLKEIMNAAQIGAERLAQTPSNQGVPASIGNGVRIEP